MIVMKFGGTSVEDATAITRLIEIVRKEVPRKPLVVVSACSGVTNELLKIARTVFGGEKEKAIQLLAALHDRHETIAKNLLTGECLKSTSAELGRMFKGLQNYIEGVNLLHELTNRTLDAFASYGERLSSTIIAPAFNEKGIPAQFGDATEVMLTDDEFTVAQPLFAEIPARAEAVFLPALQAGKVVVTQGFIGKTKQGLISTIGRGGSDYSASIFGAALGVDEIQIWTDVDGMMTIDPRIVPSAKLIESMSFDEASELAYFGAKVLHPNTILPALEKDIPVRVLNSRKPEVKGTIILPQNAGSSQPDSIVKSIAFKKGIVVINVNSSRMLMAHGFLAKLFAIFDKHEKSIDVVATSEVSVSVTVDNEEGLEPVHQDLKSIGDVKIVRNRAIVCIVGEGMKQTSGVGARIFSALGKANVNIEMVSEGASEINLTLVVAEDHVADAVRALHKEFFNA
jgi:aspartate kinase